MRSRHIDTALFINNRKALANLLPEKSIAILHSNDQYPRNGDQFFSFRQQSDLFYLTGIDQEKTILIMAPDASNKLLREVLFIIEGNEQLATWEGHKYTRDEATAISGIKQVRFVEDYQAVIRELMEGAQNVFLNQNEYPKYFSEVADRNQRLGAKIRQEFPMHQYNRLAPLLTSLRVIKSKEEIRLIQEACDITEKAFRHVLGKVKAGINEREVQAEFSYIFTCEGAMGHGYEPIIASGANACTLHYIRNDSICRDGELLLFDVGAEFCHYTADMSRTIPVSGHFTERQKACYSAVLNVQRALISKYKVGNTINSINQLADQLMEEAMIALGLFSQDQVNQQPQGSPLFRNYFMHGTAHFLGLDVHDVGAKDLPFKPGMVLTCEPGLYIREENMGIRLENNILITEEGPVDLMSSIPIDPDEIEALMTRK